MMSDIGDAIAASIMMMLIGVFVAGVLLTLTLVFGVPWLWHVLKPWLHAITG